MKSLKTKMLLLLIPVFTVFFTIVISISYYNSKKVIVNKSYGELNNFVESEKNKIIGWLNESLKVMEIAQVSIEYSEMSKDSELQYMDLVMKKSDGIVSDIYIGTTQGEMIDGARWIPPYDYDPRTRPWYKEGISNEKFTFGKPYIDMVTGKLAVSASATLKDSKGQTRGVIAGDILLDKVSEYIKSINFGKTGYAYIVEKDTGKIIGHSKNKEIVGKTLVEIDPKVKNLQEELMNKEVGTYSYIASGDKKLASFRTISQLNSNLVLVTSEKEILSELKSYGRKVAFIVLLSIVLIVLIIERMSNSIIKPIKNLVEKIIEISEGNLNTEIEVVGNDEISTLTIEFNKFINRLNSSIKKMKSLVNESKNTNQTINKTIDNIINGSDSLYSSELLDKVENGILNLVKQTEAVLDNVRHQTASSEESLAALEEISTTTINMSQNMLKTSDTFKETLEISKESYEGIKNMSSNMKDISSKMKETNNEIDKLNEISGNIGQILVSINGVANQTNLLALNAAIEAARAGEAGRGFAVVADEIRKLAEQTNKETGKIEELISTIQSSVKKVKTSGEEVQNKVIEGMGITSISEDNMEKIMSFTNENTKDISEVLNTVDEQTIASSEIISAISEITDNSSEIETLSTNTVEISGNIKKLLVNKQKLIEENSKLIDELDKDLDFFIV